ncbi:YcnI family protein [Conexibacter woesei]|uniref:Nuclear export factor GLE1 n=1 Tax=Conexibacter woesei (strain DSM 14684 / CCUG 47730 / CIP 108061 / JCM 11494 / NBRC 100937 / ID131577) TaxID=469383 RepID=D3F2P4_CONWI|nr:YcnI family protein [Conexibacter woesei]ADB54175.1 nuclear export factor GLE1 [Conexibacter woesei DSM 14684]
MRLRFAHTAARTAALAVAASAVAALASAGVAQAHVSVVPKTAPAGSFTVLDVRVPNERDDAATAKVDLKLPPGFTSVSFEPVPGWDVDVIRERLSTPIETENGPISEQVSRIVWSGGRIPPGAFTDFPISVQIPERVGTTLTFKALQTYVGGEVVRWIGAPDAELPAAQVEVVAPAGAGEGAGAGHGAEGDGGGEAAGGEAAEGGASSGGERDGAAAAGERASDDGASKGLAIAGLAAGLAGLLLGGAALALSLRRNRGVGTPSA